jgi:hypothetical protein
MEASKDFKEFVEKKYINFLRNRLGYKTKYQTKSYLIQKNYKILLGYKLECNVQLLLIRIEGIHSKLEILLQQKSIIIANPLLLIINILAKYNFCNFLGYPLSKSGWATLSDSIIISRFKSIRNSLISYYKGASNQKDVSRIQHILHYSCAKTLACKHKTNMRKIWHKYGTNLLIRDPYSHKKIFFDIITKKNKFISKNKQRFWNLYIKEPDPISIILEKTYNVKNYLYQ